LTLPLFTSSTNGLYPICTLVPDIITVVSTLKRNVTTKNAAIQRQLLSGLPFAGAPPGAGLGGGPLRRSPVFTSVMLSSGRLSFVSVSLMRAPPSPWLLMISYSLFV
jgi:hypothetical protein